jgi:hypothetical protein
LGFTAVEEGFDLCRFSRETHLHDIKISTSPTLKRPGAWPGNSKDPQNQKEEFLTLVCANLTSFKFSLVFFNTFVHFLCESTVCLQTKFCRVYFTATQNPSNHKVSSIKGKRISGTTKPTVMVSDGQGWSGAF